MQNALIIENLKLQLLSYNKFTTTKDMSVKITKLSKNKKYNFIVKAYIVNYSSQTLTGH